MESTQAPPYEDISWRVYVGTTITIVPATFTVILRYFARHVARAGFWWDDYTIVVALAVNWAMAALRWAQISAYDYGRHSHYLSPEKVEGFGKSFLAVQILYFTNAVFTKASLLLLYYRIFGVVKTFCWALWITGGLVIAYFVTCTIVSIAGCQPVSKFWDEKLPGTCIDEVAFFRWNGVGNMLLDALILCLPYPIAWRLQTSLRQKLFFTGIFLFGGLFDFETLQDPTYVSIDPATWSSVEQSVGIICACLPTLRPLFRRLYDISRNSTRKRDSSSSGSLQRDPLPGRVARSDEESGIELAESSGQQSRNSHYDSVP